MNYLLNAEFNRRWARFARYYVSESLEFLTDVVILGGLFLTAKVVGKVSPVHAFLGLILWQTAVNCSGKVQGEILTEKRYGTILQLYLTGAPMTWLLLVRAAVSSLFDLSQAILAALPSLVLVPEVLKALSPARVSYPSLLLIGGLGMMGMVGLSLLIGGIALSHDQVGLFEGAFGYLALVWTGLLSSRALPEWICVTADFLPLTDAIACLKAVIQGNLGLFGLVRLWSFWRGALIGFAYLAAGLLWLAKAEKSARLTGNLLRR